jgi:rubrerythrin
MDTNSDLLDAMAAHEEKISGLYQTFGAALPEWRDFWMTIASEEQEHASWLRGLKNRLEREGGVLNRERFNLAGIRTSMDYLQKLREEVVNKGIVPLRALALSLDIESALLEKEYYTVFKSDLVSVQEVFNNLREQTAGHRLRMQEKINQERAKQSQA